MPKQHRPDLSKEQRSDAGLFSGMVYTGYTNNILTHNYILRASWADLACGVLKVHYATFCRPVNKQRLRALDTRNSSLEELQF